MPIPLCPLFVQARATMPGAEMYPDPTKAPGVACIGSRCAWWTQEEKTLSGVLSVTGYGGKPTGRGNCGQAPNREPWPDPAAQEVSHG